MRERMLLGEGFDVRRHGAGLQRGEAHGSLPPASDSTIVLPQVPSPTTAALIMLAPSTMRLGHVSMASTTQHSIQNTQYSMPPITQIHFLVTL